MNRKYLLIGLQYLIGMSNIIEMDILYFNKTTFIKAKIKGTKIVSAKYCILSNQISKIYLLCHKKAVNRNLYLNILTFF